MVSPLGFYAACHIAREKAMVWVGPHRKLIYKAPTPAQPPLTEGGRDSPIPPPLDGLDMAKGKASPSSPNQ